MNIDELKSVWLEYDSKLKSTEALSSEALHSLIRQRSVSRLAGIQRQYALLIMLFVFYCFALGAVFIGNPFDYDHIWEFLPLVVLMICCVLMVFLLLRARSGLKKNNPGKQNLQEALQKIIGAYAGYKKGLNYTTIVIFVSSLLFPLSFLPRKMAQTGMGQALFFTVLPLLILLAVYFLAKKKGWMNRRDEEQAFRSDLEELTAMAGIREGK